MSESNCYLVVKSLSPTIDNLFVISDTWLYADGVHASVPPQTSGNRYIRMVLTHQPIDDTFQEIAVAVILKSSFYQKAMDIMSMLNEKDLPSSDSTIAMNLTPKRRIIPKSYSSDEDNVSPKKRKLEPALYTYKKFVRKETSIQNVPLEKPADEDCQPSTSHTVLVPAIQKAATISVSSSAKSEVEINNPPKQNAVSVIMNLLVKLDDRMDSLDKAAEQIATEVLGRQQIGENSTFEITESMRSWLRDCKKTTPKETNIIDNTTTQEVSYIVDLDEDELGK